MRTPAPPLAPILRSKAQAEILAMVLGDPTAEFSLTELAELVGTSAATVGREIARAKQVGVVQVRVVGRTKLVSANTSSEYFEPLAQLVLLAFGPKGLLTEALDKCPGIEAAYLYGSWAARYEGVQGPPPRDIDLLVIGNPDRSAVYAALEPIEGKLSHPIQVTFRTPEQWEEASDPFIATVRSRPLVRLTAKEVDKP